MLAPQVHDWLENIRSVPNDKWPLALVVVCASILGFIALWSLLTFVANTFGPKSPRNDEASKDEQTTFPR
jgi:hypothetical protein